MDAKNESKPILTGVYVRIEREQGWENLDLAQLQPAELAEFFGTKEKHELINWLVFLTGSVVATSFIAEKIKRELYQLEEARAHAYVEAKR